jgi:hypothetical protein
MNLRRAHRVEREPQLYVPHISKRSAGTNFGPKDNPLKLWIVERERFLAELIRLDGRGSFTGPLCLTCLDNAGSYRCTDCVGGQLYCSDCTVSYHTWNPLHRIQVRFLANLILNC